MSQYNRSHGMTGTPEFDAWVNILQRCNNPKNPTWPNYGGRGISICERWKNSFQAFFKDMGDKPFDRACIDRINNDGNYEPGNCRWTTAKRNMRNRRTNHFVEYEGQRMLLCEVCEQNNIRESIIIGRLRLGHTLKESLSMPLKPRGPKQWVEYNGRRVTLAQLGKEHGFTKDVIGKRMSRGWLLEEALSTPTR